MVNKYNGVLVVCFRQLDRGWLPLLDRFNFLTKSTGSGYSGLGFVQQLKPRAGLGQEHTLID